MKHRDVISGPTADGNLRHSHELGTHSVDRVLIEATEAQRSSGRTIVSAQIRCDSVAILGTDTGGDVEIWPCERRPLMRRVSSLSRPARRELAALIRALHAVAQEQLPLVLFGAGLRRAHDTSRVQALGASATAHFLESIDTCSTEPDARRGRCVRPLHAPRRGGHVDTRRFVRYGSSRCAPSAQGGNSHYA